MIDVTEPLFQVFAAVCGVLILKAQALAVATALTRKAAMKFVLPEDADWLGGESTQFDDPKARRVFRAHQNDLEALLPFFVSGTLYLLSDASPYFGLVYFIAFALARLTHSIAHLTGRPALRRNAFAMAWFLNIAIVLHAVGSLLVESN